MSTASLARDDGAPRMPPLVGKPVSRSLRILSQLGIPSSALRITLREGRGEADRVIGQAPSSGEEIQGDVILEASGRNPIDLLPAVFRMTDAEGGGFLRRLLRPFGHILTDLDRTISEFPTLLDPSVAPGRALHWLAFLLSVASEADLCTDRAREIIARAPDLHRSRGTRRGLLDALELLGGVRAEVEEGGSIGASHRLGIDLVLDRSLLRWEGARAPRSFRIVLPVARSKMSTGLLRRIHRVASAEKPAGTRYTLRFPRERRREPVAIRLGLRPALGGRERILSQPLHREDGRRVGARPDRSRGRDGMAIGGFVPKRLA